jgi:hypothetical protein
MNIEDIKNLFQLIVKKTNDINSNNTPYLVVRNNCTSAIRNIARSYFHVPVRHPSLFLSSFLPNYLAKIDIVKLEEEEKIAP